MADESESAALAAEPEHVTLEVDEDGPSFEQRRWNQYYDFCLVYKVEKEENLPEGGSTATTPANEIWLTAVQQRHIRRLRGAGLVTKLFLSRNRTEIFCKIRGSYKRLLLEADRVDHKLMLDPEQAEIRARAGDEEKNIKPIDTEKQGAGTKLGPYDYIYGKYDNGEEFQVLYRKYPPFGVFRGIDRLKLVYSIIQADTREGGAGLNIRKMLAEKQCVAFYSLHRKRTKDALLKMWINKCSLPWQQPVDAFAVRDDLDEKVQQPLSVRDYFGEKVAIYFAFLGHYTTSLILPAFLGLIVFLTRLNNEDDYSLTLYGLFIAMWAIVMLEFWKRQENYLCMKWGMSEYEEMEQLRPEFQGDWKPSPITGKIEKRDNYFMRLLRNLVSETVVGISIAVVVITVAAIFVYRATVSLQIGGREWGPQSAALLNGISIQILNRLYQSTAHWLNNLENHPTDTAFEDSLIAKIFLFQFVNSYSSLFYVAFLKNSVEGTDEDPLVALTAQLGIIFVSQLVVANTMEVVIPLVKSKLRSKRNKRAGVIAEEDVEPDEDEEDEDEEQEEQNADEAAPIQDDGAKAGGEGEGEGEGNLLQVDAGKEGEEKAEEAVASRPKSAAEVDFEKPPYEGTFDDYAELAVQFGFVTLFVTAFPLAPFLALLNNYVEIRVDAAKLTMGTRRSLPLGAESIGTWLTVFDVVSRVGILTNIAIVVFLTDVLGDSSVDPDKLTIYRLTAFLLAEHIILVLRYIMGLIPDMPRSAKIQLNRQEFVVSKLIEGVPDEDDVDELAEAAANAGSGNPNWFKIAEGDSVPLQG